VAISYSIDQTKGIVFIVYAGDITAEDIGGYWSKLLTDPEVLRIGRSLVDLRKARLLLTGQELQDKVRRVAAPLLQGRQWRSAIVVASPVQFGKARQYEVFSESFASDSIFTDYDDALAWLLKA
jgi:hypothetical protein